MNAKEFFNKAKNTVLQNDINTLFNLYCVYKNLISKYFTLQYNEIITVIYPFFKVRKIENYTVIYEKVSWKSSGKINITKFWKYYNIELINYEKFDKVILKQILKEFKYNVVYVS